MRLDIRAFPGVTLVRVTGGATARDLQVLEAGILHRAPTGHPLILDIQTAQLNPEVTVQLDSLRNSLRSKGRPFFIAKDKETLESALQQTVGEEVSIVLEILEIEDELVKLDLEESELAAPVPRSAPQEDPSTGETKRQVSILEWLVSTARESIRRDEETCQRFRSEIASRGPPPPNIGRLNELKQRALERMSQEGVAVAFKRETPSKKEAA